MDTTRTAPFGALLRQARRAAALSQETLAERAGLSARAISDLERGIHRTPYQATVRLLVDALGLEGEQREQLIAASFDGRDPDPSPVQTPETPRPRQHLPLPLTPLL